MAEAPGGAQATEDGSVLWKGLPFFASMRGLRKLERIRPQRSGFRNRAAVTRNAPGRGGDDADGFAAMPAPRLSIRRAGFAPDFIRSGLRFASAWFHAPLALKSGAIERCGVEMDGASAEGAVAADDRTFPPVRRVDPMDLACTCGQEPDREPSGEGRMSIRGPNPTPRRTVWKRGFGTAAFFGLRGEWRFGP